MPVNRTRRNVRRLLLAGTTVTALTVFGIGGWAATTELAGAVIAPGSLVVDTNVKKVQHPTGGIVGELRVRDGTVVRAGDILIRLDGTVTRANLAIITKSMDESLVRQARLKAEQDGLQKPVFPQALANRRSEPTMAELLDDEARLFAVRLEARIGQKAQLRERIAQLREQILGMDDQVKAKEREIVLVKKELAGVRELWSKNLIQITRLTALERDAARIEGEMAALVSTVAQTKGRIAEVELQVLQVDQDLRTEVGRDLADIRGKLTEAAEKRITAEDQLARIDIRAPLDGVVHQLAVHTVGGVVAPGDPLMLVVPQADSLSVEVRIAPQDIDQVRVGQRAVLRFSAFNQRTTPEIAGAVTLVSADISSDQKTGTPFYTVRIVPPPDEVARLRGLKLVPGMPVEGFIQTESRTALSYLTKPLMDQVTKAWREK